MIARREDQAQFRADAGMSAATAAAANAGTTPVREAHRFDEATLERWLTANVPDYAGPLRVEQFKGGQSNPTYKLVTPGRSYVLRRNRRACC